MTTNNVFTLIQMMQEAANPQQFLMNFINEQVGQSPFFANLLNLAKQGNAREIENVARNFCAQRGKDFDKEFNSFRRSMGL